MLSVTDPVRLETAPTGPGGLQIWVKNGKLNHPGMLRRLY